MPYPSPRLYSGERDCVATGTEIAHWLFCRKKTSGVWKLAAKTIASCTSPWLEAPSP